MTFPFSTSALSSSITTQHLRRIARFSLVRINLQFPCPCILSNILWAKYYFNTLLSRKYLNLKFCLACSDQCLRIFSKNDPRYTLLSEDPESDRHSAREKWPNEHRLGCTIIRSRCLSPEHHQFCRRKTFCPRYPCSRAFNSAGPVSTEDSQRLLSSNFIEPSRDHPHGRTKRGKT